MCVLFLLLLLEGGLTDGWILTGKYSVGLIKLEVGNWRSCGVFERGIFRFIQYQR